MKGSYTYTDPAVAAFVVIPVLLAAALVWGTVIAWRRSGAAPAAATRASLVVGVAATAWMAATWMAADAGVFQNWNQDPPPFAFLIAAIVALSFAISLSGLGRRLAEFLPLWVVAIQGFRLPLELAMHAMYVRGIMPREMSYSGRNFDILTGITAILVAALVASGRGGRRLVATWNVMGLGLLMNVVVVAILGTPRFRYFDTDRPNVWGHTRRSSGCRP